MSDSDLLYGAKAIANFMGLRERQVRYLIVKRTVPSFKIDGTICASRAIVSEWLQKQHERARAAARGNADV